MAAVPPPTAARFAVRWLQFDRARLRWPEWVVAASALVLLIAMFLMSWYTTTLASGGTRATAPIPAKIYLVHNTITGWDGVSHLRWLLLVTAVAGLLLFVLQAMRRAPAIPVTISLMVMLLGGLSVIWLFVRVVIDPPGGRSPGGWMGLMAAAVLTWGAFRSLKMEGILPTDGPAHIPTVPLPDDPQRVS